MKYQLVLQFQAESVQEFDELAVLEDLLVENLPSHSVVDGHDFGDLWSDGTGTLLEVENRPPLF